MSGAVILAAIVGFVMGWAVSLLTAYALWKYDRGSSGPGGQAYNRKSFFDE